MWLRRRPLPRDCPPAGLRRHRADPVRRGHHLQGIEGDRGAAGRMGRHFRHRRPRSCRGPVCKGDGLKVVAVDIAEDKLELARAAGARSRGQCPVSRRRRKVLRDTGRRSAWRAGDGGLDHRIRPGAQHGAPEGHRLPGRAAAGRHSRRRSSMSCSSGSPCAARSSAPAPTSTKPSPSLPVARCAPRFETQPLEAINDDLRPARAWRHQRPRRFATVGRSPGEASTWRQILDQWERP